jgi:hypothetical protein
MTTTALQSPDSANFAPITPLLALGRDNTKTDDYLWDCLRERFTYYNGLNLTPFNEMYDSTEMVANFINGKQFVMPIPMAPGRWLPYTPPNTLRPRATCSRRMLSAARQRRACRVHRSPGR